jgi:hypothetical protein
MIKKIFAFVGIAFLSGCSTIMSQDPDLGNKNNYDFYTTLSTSDIKVAVDLPISRRENSTTRLGKSGIFVLNLKIFNSGKGYYLLDRKDIELVSLSGFRYQALSIDEMLNVTFGNTGIYRFLFLPDVYEEYNMHGLKPMSLIEPNKSYPSTLSKYIFFHVDNAEDALLEAELILPFREIDRATKINYSVGLHNER